MPSRPWVENLDFSSTGKLDVLGLFSRIERELGKAGYAVAMRQKVGAQVEALGDDELRAELLA